MIVYFLAFTMSILIFITVSRGRKVKSNIHNKLLIAHWHMNRVSLATFFAAIPPLFVSAFRYAVGTDYFATYYTGFYRILNGYTVDGFEFGYYWLNRFIQLFTDNAFVVMAITSVLFLGIVFKTIEEESVDIPLSIILLMFTRYYFIGQNAVRQFIAVAILAYSMKYVVSKNLAKFSVCILIACSFHYTSIIFIPVFFIGRFRVSKIRLITWTIADICFFMFGVGIVFQLLKGTKYGRLLARYEVAGIKFTALTILINVILVFMAYTNYSSHQNDEKYRTYFNIQLFAFWISLAMRSIPLIERVYWMFSFPIIVSFPYFLQGMNKSKKNFWKFIVLAIFFVYMVYDIAFLGDHDALPYQWIFGKKAVHDCGWISFR